VDDKLIPIICSALNFLSRREHASLELRQKLTRKGFEPSLIDYALIQLRIDKLLSDERFVESFIYTKISKGYGPIRIEQELQKRGIPRELSLARLKKYDTYYWQRRADQIRQERFGAELPTNAKECSRQARFLRNRGFSKTHIEGLF